MVKEYLDGNSEAVAHGSWEQLVLHDGRILPPLGIELFFAGQGKASYLPSEVVTNPGIIEQAQERRDLYNLFGKVFNSIPGSDCDIDVAVKKGLVTESDVVALWNGISDFLERDEDNARILLYIPFEILPNLRRHASDSLTASGQRLADLYRQKWIILLHQSEPRANFTDGDILEPGLGRPEKKSKAGHLAPELLARGIITQDDVAALLEFMDDKEFSKSLAEGAVVSIDRGLIDQPHVDRIKTIIREKIGDLSPSPATRNESFYDPDSPIISPERAAWLRKLTEDARSDKEADSISRQIIDGLTVRKLVDQGKPGNVTASAVMKAGMLIAQMDPEKAKDFANSAQESIQYMWDLQDAKIQDAIISGLHHWVRLGVVDAEFLQNFGIALTDLSLPIQYGRKEQSEEFENLSIAAKMIREHALLGKALYPAFLLFGSRLKGYADSGADFDIALFLRPEARFEDRPQVLETLIRDIPGMRKIDKFLEFWTMSENGRLQFKMPRENTRTFVGEDQIHFLLGGIWIGEGDDVRKIRNDALLGYVNLSRYGEKREDVRGRLLGQIELDVLQYRLMHKGYRKFYPRIERKGTANSTLIDWDSDFWDSGYRRVATKLFLSRIFLPEAHPAIGEESVYP